MTELFAWRRQGPVSRARLLVAALVAVAVATGADVADATSGASSHAHPAAVVAAQPAAAVGVAVPHRASVVGPVGGIAQRAFAAAPRLLAAAVAEPSPRSLRRHAGTARTTRGPPSAASSRPA